MEEELFDAIHQYAAKHWWFRGRQKIVLSVLDRYVGRQALPKPGESGSANAESGGFRVLDLGCGVGNNLEAFQRYGEVWGADPSAKALEFCRQRFSGRLDEVNLPEHVPYSEKSFDLIVMLDVLEHIEDDVGALQRVLRLLKPGGRLVLTVPALRWLWSYHDVEHHHFRRYHRGELRRKLSRLGFSVMVISYINFLLLPLMGAARMLLKPKTWSARDLKAGTSLAAKVFELIFSFERHVLWLGTLPIGGSLLAVCRRPEGLELPPWEKGMGLPKKHEIKTK